MQFCAFEDSLTAYRRGKEDAFANRCYGKELADGKSVAVVKSHVLASGKPVYAVAETLCDAFGIGIGEQTARLVSFYSRIVFGAPDKATVLRGYNGNAAPTAGDTAHTLVPEQVDARADVGVGLVIDRVLFFEDGGNVGGQGTQAVIGCRRQHPSYARMARQSGHAASVSGNRSVLIQSAQHRQQTAGVGEMSRRGRREPGQVLGSAASPSRDIEDGTAEVCLRYFGRTACGHAALRGFRPKTVADAVGQAPCTTRTLVGHVT